MARVIGTVTPNWNTERFIVPHMKMITKYTDHNVVLQGTAPWPNHQKEHGIKSVPDKSESLIRKYFPSVEIHTAVINDFKAELYNQGLTLLKDCDIVLKFDTDMFLTEKDWSRLIKFIRSTGYDCYKLVWNKCVVEYAYDLDHGIKNKSDYEPIAVSPKTMFHNYVDYTASDPIDIDWEDFTVHHLRGWKGKANSLDWINKQSVKWLVAPTEIKKMLRSSLSV